MVIPHGQLLKVTDDFNVKLPLHFGEAKMSGHVIWKHRESGPSQIPSSQAREGEPEPKVESQSQGAYKIPTRPSQSQITVQPDVDRDDEGPSAQPQDDDDDSASNGLHEDEDDVQHGGDRNVGGGANRDSRDPDDITQSQTMALSHLITADAEAYNHADGDVDDEMLDDDENDIRGSLPPSMDNEHGIEQGSEHDSKPADMNIDGLVPANESQGFAETYDWNDIMQRFQTNMEANRNEDLKLEERHVKLMQVFFTGFVTFIEAPDY